MTLVRHLLLAVAVTAVGGTGWRVAGRLALEPLERALAAAPIAGCVAVLSALLLGRVGLGGSPVALTALAVAVWFVTPRTGGERPRFSRVGVGLVFGLVVWMLRDPVLGTDGISYHLPEVLGWLQDGDTGATPLVVAEYQTGSYPLTNEVLLAWGMGIAGSFTPVALWMAAAVGLLAASGWSALRRLGCSPALTVLALAALLTTPVLVAQLNTPKPDIPAVAWLACAGALVAARRPALLGPALAAAGLAIGSKTTTAPLAVIVLLAGLWTCRGSLHAVRAGLALGALAAVAVGGVWYLRNQIAHGWALWPFGSGPFGGDAEPIYLQRIHVSFLEEPRFTLADGRADVYVDVLAGGLVLAIGGALAVLAGRTRLVAAASAATTLAILAWMAAPFTGRAADPVIDVSLTTTRYLLPVFAAGAAALALAGRHTVLARLALVAAILWNLAQVEAGPPLWLLLAGMLVALLPRRTVAAALVVVAAAAAGGYVDRLEGTPYVPLAQYFDDQDGDEPVAFVQNVVAPVAGDGLDRALHLIPGDEPCERTLARPWVVMRDLPPEIRERLAPVRAVDCLSDATPTRVGEWLVYRQTATTSSAASRSS